MLHQSHSIFLTLERIHASPSNDVLSLKPALNFLWKARFICGEVNKVIFDAYSLKSLLGKRYVRGEKHCSYPNVTGGKAYCTAWILSTDASLCLDRWGLIVVVKASMGPIVKWTRLKCANELKNGRGLFLPYNKRYCSTMGSLSVDSSLPLTIEV